MNDTLTERPSSSRTAARSLGVDESRLVVVQRSLSHPEFLAVGHALARATETEPERVVSASHGEGVASRTLVPTPDGEQLAVVDGLVLLPAGPLTSHEVVLRLQASQGSFTLRALAPVEHAGSLARDLERFVDGLAGAASPFRGGSYRVRRGLGLEAWSAGTATRADLLVDDSVWRTVDRQVTGALDLADVLAAEGLTSSTGVLCVGPPGTGKSQLARIVAAELAGRATVLVPDAFVARHQVGALLRLATQLAPTLVVLDDLDLLLGSRHGDAEALQEFLTSMDEAMASGGGVVVMASTNAPRSIDPAAVRASRFDAVIEMGAPGFEARVRVLRRHFSRFPDLDLARVARLTEGATGADLRDLARRAYVRSGGAVTTDAVLACAEDGKWSAGLTEGAYL